MNFWQRVLQAHKEFNILQKHLFSVRQMILEDKGKFQGEKQGLIYFDEKGLGWE